ncbi:hypothetical protein SFRURICE_006711 [Spodoptera frugiperda]|nr:hypothetical protein SFRURICE_006711 [Spodoptera frugiperda]
MVAVLQVAHLRTHIVVGGLGGDGPGRQILGGADAAADGIRKKLTLDIASLKWASQYFRPRYQWPLRRHCTNATEAGLKYDMMGSKLKEYLPTVPAQLSSVEPSVMEQVWRKNDHLNSLQGVHSNSPSGYEVHAVADISGADHQVIGQVDLGAQATQHCAHHTRRHVLEQLHLVDQRATRVQLDFIALTTSQLSAGVTKPPTCRRVTRADACCRHDSFHTGRRVVSPGLVGGPAGSVIKNMYVPKNAERAIIIALLYRVDRSCPIKSFVPGMRM